MFALSHCIIDANCIELKKLLYEQRLPEDFIEASIYQTLASDVVVPEPTWSKFTEWTPDGHLRDSKFVGLREDKDARRSCGKPRISYDIKAVAGWSTSQY